MTTQAELENNVFIVKLQTQQFFRRNGLDGLVVRVEGQTDESFWRPLLETALPNKALLFFPYFDETSTTTGKLDVVKYIGFGDKQLIFCLDSDSDYLLENPILQTPFVFHTYVDAIENYWCYAEGLLGVLKKASDTEGVSFDFVSFFENYSKIIYPYLLCSLFSTKENDGQLLREELGKHAGFIKANTYEIVAQTNPKMNLCSFYQRIVQDIQTAFQN
jgi:hypothetical protein